MARPNSVDLRERVVGAVEEEEMSRRNAAAGFGVSVSTVVCSVQRYRSVSSRSASEAPEGEREPLSASGV